MSPEQTRCRYSVLFVCLGNICRSPTAHGVFEHKVRELGLAGDICTDSAGTAAYHIGNPPDQRSAAAAARRGYDLSALRARQATAEDFRRFDFILAMDESNYRNLRDIDPGDGHAELRLFMDFADNRCREVPDPYYGGSRGFEEVLELVEDAADGLIREIKRRMRG